MRIKRQIKYRIIKFCLIIIFSESLLDFKNKFPEISKIDNNTKIDNITKKPDFQNNSINYENNTKLERNNNTIFKSKEIIYNNGSIKCKVDVMDEDKEAIPTNKKIIHVAMYFGEDYVVFPLVSITSAMINCDKNNTILIYHLFSDTNAIKEMNILKSIKKKYKENVRLNFYKITNIFAECFKWRGYTTNNLRLILPELLTNIDKIIYLDADTLIFTDLTELYNLPMNDNYVLGFPDILSSRLKLFRVNSNIYINSGTLLLNFTKIRNDKMSDKSITHYFTKYKKKLYFGDQDIINFEYNPKIGLLPLKYGIFLVHDIKKYIEMTRLKLNYTEFKEAKENPKILHLTQCEPKILSKKPKHIYGRQYDNVCKYGRDLFFKYAKFTEYYPYIAKKYNFND